MRARIETLKSNPNRCPVDPDSDAFGEEVRALLYGKRHGKHRILFAIRGQTVHVLAVRHSARQSFSEKKEGGSERHIRDIAGVLKVQAERIDRESIADWATWLGLGDTWRDVLRRVENP